jgi:hypothetical protein
MNVEIPIFFILNKIYLQEDGFREVQCSGGQEPQSELLYSQPSFFRTHFFISRFYDPKSRCTFKGDGQDPGDGVKMRKGFDQSGFAVVPPTGVGLGKA